MHKNNITIIATGEGNSFSPLPLPNGRLLFVTDRADNLDLAIWAPNQPVFMWEQHPADDSSPALLSDGKTVVFLSDRGNSSHTWWQRSLTGTSVKILTEKPQLMLGKYHLKQPFDSNGDGVINGLDLGWIVDANNGIPLTPLSLNAADPVVDQTGVLWFSILQHGMRRIAYIADPASPVTVNYNDATWQQWRLLQGFQNHTDETEQNDLIWDAGLHHQLDSNSTTASLQARWQRVRYQLNDSGSWLVEAKARSLLQQAGRMHDPYINRMHDDLALWLKKVGRGTDALKQIEMISEAPWRERSALTRADLLIESGHAKQALMGLAQGKFSNYLFPDLKALSRRAVQYLSAERDEIETLQQLYQMQSVIVSHYLRSVWQLRLIELYLQRGAYEAGLQLCNEPGHKALKLERNKLRLQLLIKWAIEKQQSGRLNEALALTRQALSINIADTHAARLHFLIASTLHQSAAERLWWREKKGSKQGSEQRPEQRYIEALIFTYEGQLKRAEKLLKGVLQEQPELWVAQQTMGWLLEKGNNVNRQRQALKAYESAYYLAVSQQADQHDIVMICSNLINLSFHLKLYHKQLQLMQLWRLEKTHLSVQLLMQAARACFKLSRGADGLIWLDLLPETLDTEQRNRSLRLRALLADQSGAHESSIRALSLLIADPDLDTDLRVRLLLNRALAYIKVQNMKAASHDLNTIARFPALNDQTGLLHLNDKKLPFDASWVASSLQAEMQMQQHSWRTLTESLKRKLAHNNAPKRLQGLIYQNLAVAYMQQGFWVQAKKQLLFAEKLLRDSELELFAQVLWMRVRLAVSQGQKIDKSELSLLAKHFKNNAKRSLELEMLKLSRFELMLPVVGRESLQGSMSRSLLIRQRMADWNSLRQKSEHIYPQLSSWIDLQYFRWLQPFGNDEVLKSIRLRILSNPYTDAWVKWWFESGQQKEPKKDDGRVDALIVHSEVVLPMHMTMLKHYYQSQARAFLKQNKSRKAISKLLEGERSLSKLRHQAVKSRPLPAATSIDRLRRELRSNESILLIWPSSQAEGESDLWWMDYEHLVYKHMKGNTAADWYGAIQMWQRNKKRLFLSFVNPAIADIEAFRQVAIGQQIVLSPTLLHAVTIGRLRPDQAAISSRAWLEQLWQQADASLMDWKWNVKQGMTAYRQHEWVDAVELLAKGLEFVPIDRKENVLILIGKAAIRGGLESRALSLFEDVGKLTTATAKQMKLRLKAVSLNQQGYPLAAADRWVMLYQHSKDWRDRSVAANAMATLALQGIVSAKQVDQMITGALSKLPSKALDMQVTLQMNRMRLVSHFHKQGGWAIFQKSERAVRKILHITQDRSRNLELDLLAVEALWRQNEYDGLAAALAKLDREIPPQHSLRFKLANLQALIQQSMGKIKEARNSFLVARNALIWTKPEWVHERLAGWQNNMGRLELTAGNMQKAVAHFYAAIDIDQLRGDRVGLLYDWKNLGRLLVQSVSHDRNEGIKLLQHGLLEARSMNIPQLEVEFLFSLLAIGEKGSGQDSNSLERFTNLMKKHHYEKMNWALYCLKAEALMNVGENAEAIALLKASIASLGLHHGLFSQDDPLFSPRRAYEDLIDVLMDDQPEQALKFAERLRTLILEDRFDMPAVGNVSDTIVIKDDNRVRLIYLTGRKQTWCWLLDSDGLKSKRIAMGYQQLQEQMIKLNRRVSNRLPVKALAKRLAEEIWLPLQRWMPKRGSVDVIAIGPLERLSFAMLRSRGEWLLESYVFSYPLSVYSKSLSAVDDRTMALFSYAGRSNHPLLLTSQEVEAAQDFSHMLAYRFPNPTESVFVKRASSYDWIHVATHMNVISGQPRFSYLMLKQGDSDDGLLHVHELLHYNWDKKTIVLSGCGSREGKNPFGQAFLLAGAKQTVSNIWNGNDLSISILMKDFYRQRQRTTSISEAISRAQRWMAARYAAPVDWAGLRLSYR